MGGYRIIMTRLGPIGTLLEDGFEPVGLWRRSSLITGHRVENFQFLICQFGTGDSGLEEMELKDEVGFEATTCRCINFLVYLTVLILHDSNFFHDIRSSNPILTAHLSTLVELYDVTELTESSYYPYPLRVLWLWSPFGRGIVLKDAKWFPINFIFQDEDYSQIRRSSHLSISGYSVTQLTRM